MHRAQLGIFMFLMFIAGLVTVFISTLLYLWV